MPHIYSDDKLRLAARLYYVDRLDQQEVARFVKVSQAKVSRLLAMARERGIVRITVADYEPRAQELERRLQVELGLKSALVIKANGDTAPADLRRSVGYFAAAATAALIQAGDIVALAGGRTMHELVAHFPEPKNKALTIVQAMGSADSNVSAFDAQEIGRIMVQRLGGTFLSLNSPAFFPVKRTRDAMLSLPQVRGVLDQLNRANLALIGVGTLDNSVFVERGALSSESIKALRAAGAIGEICGRFFDAGGRECATPWRDRVVGIGLEQLKKIPQVVAIVSGSDRTHALVAAVRGKLLKSLIIDELGAEALLETVSAPTSRAGRSTGLKL